MKKLSLAILSGVAVLAVSACDHQPPTKKYLEMVNAHFWQRSDATSATYMRGPKAQQQLFKDISRCTYEIRELQRLGAVRDSTPANTRPDGSIPDPTMPEGQLESWDTPERDGYLYAEHFNYHDFETCMQFAGWERIEYLPYETADEARETYLKAIGAEDRRSNNGERAREEAAKTRTQSDGEFENLND